MYSMLTHHLVIATAVYME